MVRFVLGSFLFRLANYMPGYDWMAGYMSKFVNCTLSPKVFETKKKIHQNSEDKNEQINFAQKGCPDYYCNHKRFVG